MLDVSSKWELHLSSRAEGGREGFSAGWSGREENKQREPPWISNTCKGEYMGESVIENILTKRYLTLEIENTFRSYIDSITL